ncbi:hypothetical protein [Maridesulfovibrio hydrothermalis]|uniref:Uncharacterized protein n=1 Tax=Maridesulfovibrio hydrothermalis AM13 = DSM 14728 TaxID=1121451 RepID=L0RFL2_9BACT|nr:hypothetical protein [Maridesulfovibrio hydrothermalis]CCO25007.1 conserved protein of unknown function [Maridesulfovibrio hydrothermalis AM13 = DSM 14728]
MLVLTDLTRFKDNDNVCMALLDENDCTCYRPLPYATRAFVAEKKLLPGMIVDAAVTAHENASSPHIEDCTFENEIWLDRLDEENFKDVLERSAVDSVAQAFEGKITSKNRCVPADSPCQQSIKTIRVEPLSLNLSVVDCGEEQKIRIGFTDLAGDTYRYTPISDLHFHAAALEYVKQDRLDELNALLAGGEVVYIRSGLSRLYESKNGKQGFWMQANGIYSFPGCFLI